MMFTNNAMAQSDEIYQRVNSLWEKADYFNSINQEDSCLFYRLSVIDICKQEGIYEFLPIAEYLVGGTYQLKNNTKKQLESIPYFKDAAHWFKISSDADYEKLGLSSIEIVARTYGMCNMQDSIIDFINEHGPYLMQKKTSYEKEVLDILYWKLSAFIHLNFNKSGYREEAKSIASEIVNFNQRQYSENSIQYLSSLYMYTFCLRLPDNRQELSDVYTKAFEIWGAIPNKESHNEYVLYVNNYLTFLLQSNLLQSNSNDEALISRLEQEMYRLCELQSVNPNTKINFYITQAQYLTNIHELRKADVLCDKVIQGIHNEYNDNPLLFDRLADAYSQKARIRYFREDFSNADSLAYLAQTTIERLGNKNESYAKVLSLRSHIKSDLGEFEDAKRLGREGILIQYNCDPEKVDPYDVIHLLRLSYGEDKISQYYEYSSLLNKTYNYSIVEGDFLKYLAEGYSEIGEYERADSIYENAYDLLLKNKTNLIYQDETRWNNSISTLYFSWGKNLLCQKRISEGIKRLEDCHNQATLLLVQMYAYNNNVEKFEQAALNNFNYIGDLVKKHFMFLGDHERELYMQSVLDYPLFEIESLAALLPNNKTAIQIAFDACLLHKSMALSSYISVKNRLSNFQDIKDEIVELDNLEKAYTIAENDTQRKAIAQRMSPIERNIQRYLSSNSSLLSDIFVNWKQVKNALKDNEAVVEFICYCSNDWPWVSNDLKEIRYGALTLKKEYDEPRFVDVASSEFIHSVALNNQNFPDSICEQLWAPIMDCFHNNELVYFSPIADLNAINLEAIGNLKYPNTFVRLSSSRNLCFKKTTQVNEHYKTILYGGIDYKSESSLAPEYSIPQNNNLSTTIIKSSTLRGGNLEALPGTLEEIEMISKLFPQNSHVVSYSKSNATEESLKSLSGQQVSILHIATHGFAYGDNSIKDFNEPMRKCGLLMAGSQAAWSGGSQSVSRKEDGILLGEEIAALALEDNDLVVLSACETGAGELSSEGVFGLQRAFKKAGANSILMSLWQVDDLSTKLFMMEFYRNYISGKSKQESLKLAQRYVREYKDENGNLLYEAPTYWASWILLDALN